MKVKIQRVRENTPLPIYKHDGDAGMDLVNMGDDTVIPPHGRTLLPTGIKVAIPYGYELQIRPRSGLAINRGLTLLNTPGTIDAGYRGEVGIIIFNSNPDEPVEIKSGERIAQAVLKKIEFIEWDEHNNLDDTTRSEGGFGSTGTK
ncbi:MAG: dUTP diphosphatase [Elusimicrobiota bacterium]